MLWTVFARRKWYFESIAWFELRNSAQLNYIIYLLVLKAGISLSVGVGDYSEPHDIPGLAHLCEHVMLAGSSKYPGMAFDAFLSVISFS